MTEVRPLRWEAGGTVEEASKAREESLRGEQFSFKGIPPKVTDFVWPNTSRNW